MSETVPVPENTFPNWMLAMDYIVYVYAWSLVPLTGLVAIWTVIQ